MHLGDLERRRARSFGSRAADYHRHRPDYPPAGIRWALAAATGAVRRVLDLGAGTGKLTEGLLALDVAVVAVEPDADMRAELNFPEVTVLDGTAERIPLPAAAVDAVLVGQAFHWFDAEPALTEIARVLRPGGALGALWNGEDTGVEWVAGVREAARTSIPEGLRGELELPAHPSFEELERTRVPHTQRRTIESLAESFGTHSRMLVAAREERAQVLDRIRRYLRSRPETAAGEFDLPLVTAVIRAHRR